MTDSQHLELFAVGESQTFEHIVTFDKASIALSTSFASEEEFALLVSAANKGFIRGTDACDRCDLAKLVAVE